MIDNKKFNEMMEEIDFELTKKGIPIHRRELYAHSEISKRTGDYGPLTEIPGVEYPEYVGPNLSNSISEWYSKRWADRSYLKTTVGIIPILLRGEVFVSRVPLVYGSVDKIPILQTIEDMTEDFVKSLTENEQEIINKKFEDGYNLVYEIDDMVGKLGLRTIQNSNNELFPLLHNAIEDCRKAVLCLSENSDTNGSCFHSQQFAEKMLKGYIKSKGCQIGNTHKLKEEIFIKCKSMDSTFLEIVAEVDALNKISMNIRYSDPKSSNIIAYEDFWNSLRIGGFCACKISGSSRRFLV